MGIKQHKPEEIVTKLRQAEVLVDQGMARIDAIRLDQYCRTDVLSLAQALWWYEQRPTERTETAAKRE